MESMDGRTVMEILQALESGGISTIDITGGAPELNPHLRDLVTGASERDVHVIVRTNLAILREPGMESLPEFFRSNHVELIASLPCYIEETVDSIRGRGTFRKCIEALSALNSLGYGHNSELKLNLVFNPKNDSLPPVQASLEKMYRRELEDRYGIVFTSLYVFGNMPIGRFGAALDEGRRKEYMGLLAGSFNIETLGGLMCRSLISVGWDGRLYDCDFNQALGIPIKDGPGHISGFNREASISRRIAVGDHCWACAAGIGFTCFGSIK